MSRYIRETELNQPIDVVSMMMDDFVYHNRFTRADWNGEMVYFLKDNHGKERYMKWYYTDGVFHVEAWLKGSFGNETALDGGGASKREFRQALDNLMIQLKNHSANSVAGGHVGSDPLHHDSGQGTNHDTWENDTAWQQETGRKEGINKLAPENIIALFFAIFAISFGGCFPLFGIVFAVIAMKKCSTDSWSKLIKVLAIVAIVVSVIGFVSSMFGGLAAFLFNFNF